MLNKKAARELGVSHDTISLICAPYQNKWKHANYQYTSVEEAALNYFQSLGWDGYPGEGGLILNLIKVLSFKDMPEFQAPRFLANIYDLDRHASATYGYDPELEKAIRKTLMIAPVENLLTTLEQASVANISNNYPKIPKDSLFNKNVFIEKDNLYLVSCLDMISFYNSIDRKALNHIAKIFSQDPYEYSIGWPDLTLWNEVKSEVCFYEIKSPNDRLRASQKKVMNDILIPLGLTVGIIDVLPINA